MKGISTILATILIVIIVVALVSLTYTFAIGIFGTTTRGAEAGVTATTIRLDKAVAFVTDPACVNNTAQSKWTITFTIRHTGATHAINYDEIAAYFGTDETETDFTTGTITPGTPKTIVATSKIGAAWGGATRSFTVSAPAGEVSKSITCPSL